MAAAYSLRPVGPEDDELLFSIYASTRTEELAIVPWSEEVKGAFLRQQFGAQAAHYRVHYAEAELSIVEVSGVPAGRLYVARWPRELRIMDISLLPQHRRQGLGTAILTDLLAEATATNRVASIHVERNNPALQLYERLGFQAVADRGVYLFLERQPPVKPAPEARPC